MKHILNQCYDEERALYGSESLYVSNCQFDGIADGESALKESKNILVENCFFNLRYPFWHDDKLTIKKSEMTHNCRAPIWYSKNINIEKCKINGVKAIRECENVRLYDSKVVSNEFCWMTSNINVNLAKIEGEYMFFKTQNVEMKDSEITGKYSFQYMENAKFENCNFRSLNDFLN